LIDEEDDGDNDKEEWSGGLDVEKFFAILE
jgi:hypothetical protein